MSFLTYLRSKDFESFNKSLLDPEERVAQLKHIVGAPIDTLLAEYRPV